MKCSLQPGRRVCKDQCCCSGRAVLSWAGFVMGRRWRRRSAREGVCVACRWKWRSWGNSGCRGAHRRTPSPALRENHRLGSCRRWAQLSEGRYGGGEGGGGQGGGGGWGQGAPRLALDGAEGGGHVAGGGGAALEGVGVQGAALPVTQQTGVERTGGLRGSSSSSAATPTHTFQLLQCVQDHVGGVCVFGALPLQLTELTQGRAHGHVDVLQLQTHTYSKHTNLTHCTDTVVSGWSGSSTCELCSIWAMTSGSSGLWLLKLLERPAEVVFLSCGLSTWRFRQASS